MKKRLSILALILAGMIITSCGKETSTSVSTSDPASDTSTPTSVGTSGSTSKPSESTSAPSTSTSSPSVDTTVHVTGVNVDQTSVELIEGETHEIVATVLPEDATDKSVIWTSDNDEVATVVDGVITAVNEGNAIVTVTTTDGGHTATISVIVTKAVVHVESVSLNETNVEIEEGETFTFVETVLPEDAADKSVTWSSSDNEIATVNEGVVSAVKEGSTTITVTTNDGGHVATANVVVTKHYAITVGDTAGIDNLEVAEKAKEGELVEITLTYNKDALIIDAVMANEVRCGTSNGKYYFYMPSEDVEITVITSTVASYYTISNENKNSVTLIGNATAVAGEEVSLSFTLAPGYNFNGSVKVYGNLDAFDREDRTVIPSTFEDGVIKFTMPEENVAIEVGVSRAYFQMTKIDDNYHINTVRSDGQTVTVSSGKYDIKYDTTVQILFTQSSSYLSKLRPIGIYIPELNLTIMDADDETENSVSFKMPHFDITVQVITEKVYRNFTIANSEHISVLAYSKMEDGSYVALEENKAVYGDDVYLKATITDESVYSVKSLKGVYYGGTSTYTSTITPTLEADGYYKFTMPEVKTGTTLDFTVLEKDITLFAGASFLGNYKGFNSYGTNISSASTSMSIDASGAFVKGTDEYTITNAENGVFTILTNAANNTYGKAYYDDKMVASAYTIGSDIFTNDMYVYFKVEESDNLTVYAQRINSKYHVGEILKNGEPYVSYFIDPDNDMIYTDVTFNFTEGTHVNDAKVSYTIKDSEGKAFVTISGTNVSSRTVKFLSGLEGEYTLNNKTLVVDTDKATYDDHTWSYTIVEGNKIRMQYADETKIYVMVVVLNTDGTATIESSSEEDLAPVYQKAYWGKTAYNYHVYIYFNNPDKATFYCKYDLETKIPSSSADAYNGYDAEARYSYDSASNTITLVTKGETIVLHVDEAGTLTIISGSVSWLTGGPVTTEDPTFTEFTPTF